MPGTLDISEARKRFNTLDRELKDRPVIYITRHNREAFAIVDIDYLETVMETMEVLGDPEAMQMLNESLRAVERGELIDQEDVEKELA
ncbi:MAG: type II toxin-antitoxin system Phd/YefM family antitoxin [Gammaproteobacteria bacterium]